jgi:hypothetical protein
MEWWFIIALVVAIPIILFPAAFVWYLNIGGILSAIKEARAKQAAREKGVNVAVQRNDVVAKANKSTSSLRK